MSQQLRSVSKAVIPRSGTRFCGDEGTPKECSRVDKPAIQYVWEAVAARSRIADITGNKRAGDHFTATTS